MPEFTFSPVVDPSISRANADFARSLDLPSADDQRGRAGPLAVVGGGLSVHRRLQELREWEGDIWAINETWRWLQGEGINSTFYSVHPRARVAQMLRGAQQALLALQCAPECYAMALRHKARILTTDLEGHDGSSSAPRAARIALQMGYESVTFFGIDCCFQLDKSHIGSNHAQPQAMLVECGQNYLTNPQLYLQAKEIVAQLKEFPDRIFYRGGGLLHAFMTNDQHEVTLCAPTIHDENTGWGDDVVADIRAAE